ncbi:secreted frizzled-related protein 3 [Lates japonicus]|uniref:Secreted frizzled-related protein 3 n=1 Tax=Lates japonicus TaxID=270547 RepID=A0AAD3MKX8_LATJO|nr:secreted frizzled-related protein 3 [Lates japonicus]
MLSPGLSVSLLAVSCALWPAAVRAASCEPVRIPLCRSMPWNMTKMPNHLHHSTQDNAVLAIEQFEGLLGTGCSPDLLFFLCAMYAPICTIDFQHEPIKPCKAVCERAKYGCEPVMKRYNHSWPDSLACSELPLYDRGVCISPEAIVKAEGPDPYYQDPARCNPESSPDFPMDSNNLHCRGPNGDRCRCKTIKMNQRTYTRNNYNYGRGVREVRNRGLEPTAVVEVKGVFSLSGQHSQRDTDTLLVLLPVMSSDSWESLIMGYENEASRNGISALERGGGGPSTPVS